MRDDDYWVVVYLDGEIEDFFATPKVEGTVLVMREHYGVTGGVKQETMIPLAAIKQWRKKRSIEERK